MANQRITQVMVNPVSSIDSTIGLEQLSLFKADGTAVDVSGFVQTGNATLVAGTIAVSNTNVTSNLSLRVFVRTPGGTVGAPFLASITAGTGFTLKSTSATDTSTLTWEIKTY